MGRRISVIDDDLDVLSILEFVLVEEGFEVFLRSIGAYASDIWELGPEHTLQSVSVVG